MISKIKSSLNGLIAFSLISLSASAELDSEKRDLIKDKIVELQVKALERSQKAAYTAINVFSKKATNTTSAFKFYEDCNKLIFDEELKSSSSFREWQDRNTENVNDAQKAAIRYQLQWLSYSLEADRIPKERINQEKRIIDLMTRIVNDEKEEDLSFYFSLAIVDEANKNFIEHQEHIGQRPLLNQDPYQSVFARAYKVTHLKPENWPKHPLDFDGIYMKLVVPKYLEEKKYRQVREKWAERIKAEATLHLNHGEEPKGKIKDKEPYSYKRFLDTEKPRLMFEIEKILFEAGDEEKAAGNMYNIIKSNLDHVKHRDWLNQLNNLLEKKKSASN